MRKLFLLSVIALFFFSFQIQGQTWSGLTRLTWNTKDSCSPSIAADTGSGVHVVWYEFLGYHDIFYKRSTDRGDSWSGPTRLTWNDGDSLYPSIAADVGGRIHVVWSKIKIGNPDIFYKRSIDSGASWSGLTRLTWNSGYADSPSIAADAGSGIHVVWMDDSLGNIEIYYKRSTDSGASWSGLTRLTWNSGWSCYPSIAAASGNKIHVVWSDNTGGNYEIFYKRSTDSGTSWSGLTRLTWNVGFSTHPFIAADAGSGIHIVWSDDTWGNYEIFYIRSTDSGTSWSGVTRLTWNAQDSKDPSIAADDGGRIHVVWRDYTPGNYEILYKDSTDSGASWSGLTRLTWNSGQSEYPSIAAASPTRIHVVWQDTTPGNPEIFYKNRK